MIYKLGFATGFAIGRTGRILWEILRFPAWLLCSRRRKASGIDTTGVRLSLPHEAVAVDEAEEVAIFNPMEIRVPNPRSSGRKVSDEERFGPNVYGSRLGKPANGAALSNADRLLCAGKWSTHREIAVGSIITQEEGCWYWTGSKGSNGYGRISRQVDGARLSSVVHQLTWLEANGGPWPEGMVGRHSCRNRDCCAPDHITPGTYEENVRDAQFQDGTMDVHISRFPEHLRDALRSGEAVEWEGRIWEPSQRKVAEFVIDARTNDVGDGSDTIG